MGPTRTSSSDSGVSITVAGVLFIELLVYLLGATDTIAPTPSNMVHHLSGRHYRYRLFGHRAPTATCVTHGAVGDPVAVNVVPPGFSSWC